VPRPKARAGARQGSDSGARDGLSGPQGPAWDRLEDQIDWYDRSSTKNKRAFQQLKVLQLVAAAVVPVVASVHAAVWLIGGLGAGVVVVEGIQQLGQFQQNWINYRSTSEALKHEKYLFLSRAGPYQGRREPDRLLAERVEGLVSQEHAKWTAGREESASRDTERSAAGPAATTEKAS
jgi:hypothetical protein